MAPHAAAPVEDDTPAIVSQAGQWTLDNLIPGCKVWTLRPRTNNEHENEVLHAEIISLRDKPSVPPPIHTTGLSIDLGVPKQEKDIELYVHYQGWNKRLDEWIPGTRVLLDRELTWPKPPKKDPPPKAAVAQKALKKAGRAGSQASQTPSLKRKVTVMEEDERMDDGDEPPLAQTAPHMGHPFAPLSKQEEIEHLRVSGSMSHSHEARVKNLTKIHMGKSEIEPWYFSPYPVEYAGCPVLYICEFCLRYRPNLTQFKRHRAKCTLRHPPGNEVYRDGDISFFEIDGRRQKDYCRNLCLLSKCFLDHKTLYFDVDPFLFYILVQRDSHGCHLVGYFSKEKESGEGYNVACILTLPQYQRLGYGHLLIEFSYELTKRENKVGSPEKPLSDLGLIGYRAYWGEAIVQLVKDMCKDRREVDISIDEISQKTGIIQGDVMSTCNLLSMLKSYKGQHILLISDDILEKHEKAVARVKRRIDPSKLVWKPPVFSRNQLNFGF